jgi:predicted dehydrogenase
MAKALRLGLIGTGVAARELYAPAFKAVRHKIELVACANRTRAKAEAYAKALRIPKVVDTAEALIALPEVDAVMISLPIDRQPLYVLKALRAGKPVLSEKPVAPNVAEGRRLVKAAAKYDVPWLVGENFAFMNHVTQLEGWINAGKLGSVRLIQVSQMTRMNEKNPYFNTAWRADPAHVGGFIVDGGVHVANVVRRCFGMPRCVRGLVGAFDERLPPIDTAVSVLRFESGALGTWTSCFCAEYDGPLLRVFGSRANAELGWDAVTLKPFSGAEKIVKSKGDSFAVQFEHFADVVLRGKPLRVTPKDALADLSFMEELCAGKSLKRVDG